MPIIFEPLSVENGSAAGTSGLLLTQAGFSLGTLIDGAVGGSGMLLSQSGESDTSTTTIVVNVPASGASALYLGQAGTSDGTLHETANGLGSARMRQAGYAGLAANSAAGASEAAMSQSGQDVLLPTVYGFLQPPDALVVGTSGYFFAHVSETLHLGSELDPMPIVVLLERLVMGEQGLPLYDGTAELGDAVAFGEDLTWVIFKTLEETVVFDAGATPSFTTMIRVVEQLVLSGAAANIAEAVVLLRDAMVLRALAEAFQVGHIVETLLTSANIEAVYSAVGRIIEQVLLSGTPVPSYTAMVVVSERVAMSASAVPTELELVALVRESIGFAANITIDNQEYIAWVLNTESKGLSRYTQYPFNSFAKIGGRYVGCASDGLHWLEGDTDNGDDITARIRLGMNAMGTRRLKRMPECFIGYTSTGVLLLKAIVTDENSGDRNAAIFRLRPRPAQNVRENRFTLGRGLKAIDWDFEFENVDGADFELRTVEFRPLLLDRRTRG